MNAQRPTCRRRAWTLVELLVSAAAATVLVAGMASAVVLATRSLPGDTERASPATHASLVMERLAADLMCAVQISERTNHRIALRLPDRNGDGLAETLVYDWPAETKGALRLSRNGSEYVDLLPGVTDFTLVAGTTTVTEQTAPTEESGDVLLASCLSGSLTYDALIQGGLWTGNVCRPNLPADTVRWKPKSVWIYLAQSGAATGTARLRLYALDWRGNPTGSPLAQTTINESTLSTGYQWYEWVWSGLPDLVPGAGIAFVVEHVSNAPSCRVGYRNSPAGTSQGFARVVSTDGGSSWNLMPTFPVIFAFYGTVTREVPGGSVQREYLHTLRVRLQTDGAADGPLEMTVRLLNTPEVGG